MVVSVSPRLSDDLEYDSESECFVTDPRFSFGFQSLSLEPSGYSDHEIQDDRAFASTPDPSVQRRRRRQRDSDTFFAGRKLFEYNTVADGDAFRLVQVQAGTGIEPIECKMLWENSKHPEKAYDCLSYAWESPTRDEMILLDGFVFPVTKNLLCALQNLRKPRATLIIWIDQICINQYDNNERGHQVSIMKHIFNQARKVHIWLGEADYRSRMLCDFAKTIRRGEVNASKRPLNKTKLKEAIQSILERPWFSRVWVIPEVVLSKLTTVAWTTATGARARISWDHLVKLVRDVTIPAMTSGFDKQVSLLGNPRQRIAIITQMIASQRKSRDHTDISQLLILSKSSGATDVRDKVYAFYALTYLATTPNYSRSPGPLFVDIIHLYIENILDVDSYSSIHDLSEEQKNFQLMSILYSAGQLHQHRETGITASWIPDWTYSWHLAPIWCQSIPNFGSGSSKDVWSMGIRSDYRAGGDRRETFQIREGSRGQLKVSALVLDSIVFVHEVTPLPTPNTSQVLGSSLDDDRDTSDTAQLRYGRHFFTTAKGFTGYATPGIREDDQIGVILGGDAPVVLRAAPDLSEKFKAYRLLCEGYVASTAVMSGDFLRENWTLAEDIILV